MFGLTDCPVDLGKLTASISTHEGFLAYAYDDANGKPIISGYTVIGTPTIGYGVNLAVGVTQSEAAYLRDNRIQAAIAIAETQPWWGNVQGCEPRARALCEIVFNLGIGTFNKFTETVAALEQSDWPTAGAQLLNSLWAREVGQRAEVLAGMVVSGVDAAATA